MTKYEIEEIRNQIDNEKDEVEKYLSDGTITKSTTTHMVFNSNSI